MPRGQAHRHPVRHEQDQGSRDVDGEEGVRGSSEAPPAAAAEQVLVRWMGREEQGWASLPPLPLRAQGKWLAAWRSTYCRLPSLASTNHLLESAPGHLTVLVEARLREGK